MPTYEEFRASYEQQHPASVPRLRAEVSIYPDWLEKAVGLMFICASLLSGVHTIPAVRNGMSLAFWGADVINAVSLTSFIAVELVFLVGAYAMMRRASWYVVVTLGSAFVVAMVANLQQNVEAYRAADAGTVIVAVTFGIGAPLMAFMAGKMFVDIHRARRQIDSEAQRRYDDACIQWDAEIGRAWARAERARASQGASRVSSEPETLRRDGAGVSDQETVVLSHFQAHPEDVSASTRDLEAKIGVSRSTVSRARRKWLDGARPLSANGHGAVE